ncbi:hypothetical protein ACFL0Z_00115 [Patescibacteria group bacterium]
MSSPEERNPKKETAATEFEVESEGVAEKGSESEEADSEVMKRSQELISLLDESSLDMDDKKKEAALEILVAPECVNSGRNEISSLLAGDGGIRKLLEILGDKSDEFLDVFNGLVKAHFTSSEITGTMLRELSAESGDVVGVDGSVALEDLNSLNLDTGRLKEIIAEVTEDSDMSLENGYFWNVMIPGEEEDYVVKINKYKEGGGYSYTEKQVADHKIIQDAVGSEYLPRQAVLKNGEGDLVVVQEKADLDNAVVVTEEVLRKMGKGEIDSRLREAFAKPENNDKVKRFLAGLERLRDEHDLLVDFLGRNVCMEVGESGDLKISILDYGCFEARKAYEVSEIIRAIDRYQETIDIVRGLL